MMLLCYLLAVLAPSVPEPSRLPVVSLLRKQLEPRLKPEPIFPVSVNNARCQMWQVGMSSRSCTRSAAFIWSCRSYGPPPFTKVQTVNIGPNPSHREFSL